MADEPGKSKQTAIDRAEAAQREREARLAGALRNNLRRRKPPELKISERPGVKGADSKDQDPHG